MSVSIAPCDLGHPDANCLRTHTPRQAAPLKWSVLPLKGDLGGHATEWDALNRRRFRANPMLDSRFVNGLLRHFGDKSVRLCVLWVAGAVRAMCLLRPKGLGLWTTFLPPQAQIGPMLMARADDADSLLRSLPGLAWQIDFLCSDADFGPVSQAGTNAAVQEHALTMNIVLTGSFDAYWAQRSSKLQANIRRYERRLGEDGLVARFVQVSDIARINAAVARYAALESSGWKAAAGTAIGLDNPQGRFYGAVLRHFAHLGGATVYELWLNDHLAASRLALASTSVMTMLKTTYDENLDKYAPGRLLLRRVIEHAFTVCPGGTIEFYTDANPDLLSWSTGQRWIEHISVYRNAVAATLIPALNTLRKSVHQTNTDTVVDCPKVHVDVLYHPSQFPANVQKLFDLAERDDLQCGTTWFSALTHAVFADHSGVRFYVLRQGDQPIAVLPVQINQVGPANQIEALSSDDTALYAPALAPGLKTKDLVPLLRAVLQAHAPVARLRFAPMDRHARPYRLLLGALQRTGLLTFQFPCFESWRWTGLGHRSSYLAGHSESLRRATQLAGKRWTLLGGTLEIILGGTDLQRGLDAYRQLLEGRCGNWRRTRHPTFTADLAQLWAANGWLRLGVAWLNGQPIAAQIWTAAHGQAHIDWAVESDDFQAHEAGTLLTALLMQHVTEQDHVTAVDLRHGGNTPIRRWMNHRRQRWGIVAYNLRTPVGLAGLCREAAVRSFGLIHPPERS